MPLINHSVYQEQWKQLQNRHIEHFKRHIHRTNNVQVQIEDDRTGMTVEALKQAFIDNLYYILGKDEYWATPRDYYMALAYTVRDRLLHRFSVPPMRTIQQSEFSPMKEFRLMGSHFED